METLPEIGAEGSTDYLSQVWNGLGCDTIALQYLTQFWGNGLVCKNGTEMGFIPQLIMPLLPVFTALMVVMLIGTFMAGVIKSATEGQFLGRDWHSMFVPAQIVLCIVLLSPSPAGVTFGNLIYARVVVLGNNFADVMWRHISNMQQIENMTLTSGGDPNFKVEVSNRLLSYSKAFICADYLKKDGYWQMDAENGHKEYKSLMKNACGIPEDRLDEKGDIKIVTNAPVASTDPTAPTQTAEEKAKSAQDKSEFGCYLAAYKQHISGGLIKSDVKNAEGKIKLDAGKKLVTSTVDATAVRRGWYPAVAYAADCVYMNVLEKSGSINQTGEVDSKNEATNNYRRGWAGAAGYGNLNEMQRESWTAKIMAASPPVVNPSAIGGDAAQTMTIQGINTTNVELGAIVNSPEVNLILTGKSHSSGPIRQAVTSDTGLFVFGAGLALFATKTPALKESSFSKFSQVSKNLKFLGKGLLTAWKVFLLKKIAVKTTQEVAEGNLLGKVALGSVAALAAGAAAVSTMIIDQPIVNTMLLVTALIFMYGDVVYQVIFALAVFLWLYRASIWFLLVPFATVIAAIPNTQAGHGAWKGALSIALVPIFIIIFYVIGILSFGVVIDMGAQLIFSDIVQELSKVGEIKNLNVDGVVTALSGLGGLLVDILTGEAIFRVIAFGMLALATYAGMAALILKGPYMVLSSIGLNAGHDELAGDLGTNPANKFGAIKGIQGL